MRDISLNRKNIIKTGLLEHKKGRKNTMNKHMGNCHRLSFFFWCFLNYDWCWKKKIITLLLIFCNIFAFYCNADSKSKLPKAFAENDAQIPAPLKQAKWISLSGDGGLYDNTNTFTLYRKKNLRDAIKTKILRWGDDIGLRRWAQWTCKGPYKSNTRAKKEEGNVMMEQVEKRLWDARPQAKEWRYPLQFGRSKTISSLQEPAEETSHTDTLRSAL